MQMTTDYRKDANLHKLHVELEWRRCANDEQYFFKNYIYIPSESDVRGRIKFNLFDYQEELLDLFTTNRFVIALKARQLGYTTLAMAHSIWLAFFRPGATILVVSQTQKSANKNLAQARLAYQFLPIWMKERAPKLVSDSTDGMAFQFGDGMVSKLKSASAVESVFAGETATLVILDEAGLVEPAARQEDVFRTLLPTTDAGGSMLIISTSRGNHNRFAKTYRHAKRGESQFVSFFRSWKVSPFMQCGNHCNWCGGPKDGKTPCTTKYDLKRREFADQPWRFFQEYPRDEEEAFRESGRPRFQYLPPEPMFMDFPYRGNIHWENDDTLTFEHDENGPLRLMTIDPDPNAFYVIGADPAQGGGGDYSTAHLLSFDEDQRVQILGYYHSNTIPPTEFAADLDKLGRYYKGRQWAALMAVENQGSQGSLPINELHKHLDYPNAYMHQMSGTKTRNKTRIFEFPMTTDRRKAVIDRLAQYLVFEESECKIDNIYPLLRTELGQFVMQETASGSVRYAADTGCHDDLVMSIAISLWVLVEEHQLASPQTAYSEGDIWKPTGRINLKSVREARQRAIDEMEEANRQQWEAFQIASDSYTRGFNG
jgi:hypothetical protein